MSNGLARRTTTEVVVATRSGRLSNNLQVTEGRSELEHGAADKVSLEPWRLAVRAASVEVDESEGEPLEIALAHRRHDVESGGEFVRALDHAPEGTDHDVGDAPAVERLH